MRNREEITSQINDAVKLHGHLGPFLVIGVLMGNLAKRTLNINEKNKTGLQATVRTPPSTPFTCTIDGIQATTTCTVGNQRLKIRSSQEKIAALFQTQNPHRTLRISVRPKVIEELNEKTSKRLASEELVAKIVSLPTDQLFEVEKH
jgi:formylmethanofuran dehydrogenase subunit E